MTKLIVNKDVTLRAFESRDALNLQSFRNDQEAVGLLGGFATSFAIEDALDWISRHRKYTDERLWAIADAGSDCCIGHVGLYKIDHRIRKAEFGILIGDTTYHRRGIGTQVTSRVLDYGFDQLNLNKISLSVLITNVRARALYTKLGFVEEGRLRDDDFRNGTYNDTILMGLLAEERKSNRS